MRVQWGFSSMTMLLPTVWLNRFRVRWEPLRPAQSALAAELNTCPFPSLFRHVWGLGTPLPPTPQVFGKLGPPRLALVQARSTGKVLGKALAMLVARPARPSVEAHDKRCGRYPRQLELAKDVLKERNRNKMPPEGCLGSLSTGIGSLPWCFTQCLWFIFMDKESWCAVSFEFLSFWQPWQ